MRIPRGNGALRGEPVDTSLTLMLMSPEDSIAPAAAIYAAPAAQRPGMMARNAPSWQAETVFDPESERDGASAVRAVVARYAFGKSSHSTPLPRQRLRFLTDLDLTTVVSVTNRPVDDPLLENLADLRAARPALTDNLYVRLVDVPAALSARTLSAPLDLVVEIDDALCAWNAGRWRVEGDATGVHCVRTPVGASADLAMTATNPKVISGARHQI